MKKLFILSLIIISYSCVNNRVKEKGSTIDINIIGIDSTYTFILDSLDSNGKQVKIDSIKLNGESSKFYIKHLKTPKEYYITIKSDSLKRPISRSVWVENKDVKISGNINSPSDFVIQGGELNKITNEFADIFKKYNTPEIEKEIISAKTPEEQRRILNKYFEYINTERINLAYKKPNNIISLKNITQLKKYISSDSLKIYYEHLDPELKKSSNGKLLHEAINFPKLKVGDYVQDFEAKDINGKTINFSDFKGKVILLDFWASWCVPCNKQNKEEFQVIFERFKDQNFVLLSYSIDKESDKEKWVKASIENNIRWVNISNLKGSKDPLSIQYQVTSYPTTFLINNNGKIIKSFSGYHPENKIIEKEIEKLFEDKTTHNKS